MTELDGKVIGVWTLVYDEDANQTYEFSSFDKVLASIETSMRGYLGSETQNAETLYSSIIDAVNERRNHAHIPLRIKTDDNILTIALYYWELSAVHPVHKVLKKCYERADDTLKQEIGELFSDSRY